MWSGILLILLTTPHLGVSCCDSTSEQVALLGAEVAARRDNVNGDEAKRSQ